MRKSIVVSAPFGRDREQGRIYKITEMPAAQAEKWALKAFLALQSSGERIPENLKSLGMVGVAVLGLNIWLRGNVRDDVLIPLMDEMMTCVQMIRDPASPDVVTPIVSDDDIEEVQTRLWLRAEIVKLHTGFSPADALSMLISEVMAPADTSNM